MPAAQQQQQDKTTTAQKPKNAKGLLSLTSDSHVIAM